MYHCARADRDWLATLPDEVHNFVLEQRDALNEQLDGSSEPLSRHDPAREAAIARLGS